MEKEVKLGDVGSADLSASAKEEKSTASVVLGPLKISLVAELDNRAALDYLASKLPGGYAHDAIVIIENLLFPKA